MKEFAKKPSVGARIIEGLEELVGTLERKESITETFNCRVVELDLQPTTYTPQMVKDARKLLRASQAVFARLLGVSVKTVRAWEQGLNTPSDMAARFMDEIRRDPAYWLKRLRQAAVAKQPIRTRGCRD